MRSIEHQYRCSCCVMMVYDNQCSGLPPSWSDGVLAANGRALAKQTEETTRKRRKRWAEAKRLG